jgi:hypothetical protein
MGKPVESSIRAKSGVLARADGLARKKHKLLQSINSARSDSQAASAAFCIQLNERQSSRRNGCAQAKSQGVSTTQGVGH